MMSKVGVPLEKIPLESGTVLVYAPTVPSAFCPNSQLIAVLEAVERGCYASAVDPEGAGLSVLTTLGLISGDDSLQALPLPGGARPRGTLVVAVDLRGEPDDLVVDVTESSACGQSGSDICDRRAELFAVVEAVHEKAVAQGCTSIALELRLAEVAPSCWSLAAALAAHARTLAQSGACPVQVRLSLLLNDPGQLPFEGKLGVDSLTLVLPARELQPSEAGRLRPRLPPQYVELMESYRAAGAAVRLQLAVDLVALKHLADLVGVVCQAIDGVEIEIIPEVSFIHEDRSSVGAIQQLLAAFRQARRVSRDFKCALSFPGACPGRLENFDGVEPVAFILPSRRPSSSAGVLRSAPTEMRRPSTREDPHAGIGTAPATLGANLALDDSEPPVRPACCRDCFARHTCTPGAASDRPEAPWTSPRCSVVRELLKEELLLRIADGGGLGWVGRPTDTTIGLSSPAGQSSSIEVTADHDAAWVRSDGSPPPGVYPVLALPWEGTLSRRAFLGVSIAAGLAMATFRTRALAACPTECAQRPDASACLDSGIDVAMPAGVQVAPSLLSAVGIAAGTNDTIEQGFHLRWFLGKDLQPPAAAFPAGISSVRAFVDLKFDRAKPPDLIIEPPSPPQRATVTGRVLNRDRRAVDGATVRLMNSREQTVAETTTNWQGRYELRNVRHGCYALGVGKAGFKAVLLRNIGIYGVEEQLSEVLLRAGQPLPPEIRDVNPQCPDPPHQEYKKPGHNESVPPAFHIFRREHHPHFDRAVDVSEAGLSQLRQSPDAIALAEGVRAAVEKRDPLSASPPPFEMEWPPSPPGWPPTPGPVTYPSWVRGAPAEVLVVRFGRDTNPATSRVVHFARLTATRQSLGRPDAVVLELYADGDAEPLRRDAVAWSSDGLLRWKLNWVLDQGHCDTVKVVARALFPLRLEYSFMDEDAKIADPQHPLRPDHPFFGREWIHVASTSHITYFQSWEYARDECFRHEIKNRFLDFALPGSSSSRDRLDKKYKPWFATLQQAFLRLRLAQLLDRRFLTDGDSASLTELRYEPYFMLQMWALDPIHARMLGQAYSDVRGQHNLHQPTYGKTYDYMVTTAWHTQACRLLYITQKVSTATTPAVPSIATLSPKQLDGQVTESGRRLYQVALSWKAAQGPSSVAAELEAPLFDISRGSSASDTKSLTHYVDDQGDVVDAPIHPALSVPHLRSDDPPNRFSPAQRDALQLMQTLQTRDANRAITRAQVTALEAMQGAPAAATFRLQEPDARFMEWLPAPPAERECEDVYYSVRAIDLFGRTSMWSEPARLKLCHRTPPAAPVSVQARLTGSDGGQQFLVAWRYGAAQTRASGPVSYFSILAAEVNSGTSRPDEDQWTTIKTDVAFEPAIAVRFESVDPINGQSIAGTIVDARSTSGELATKEEGKLLGATNKRLVHLTTSQCFFGTSPCVDLRERWSGREGLLDKLKLTIRGSTYDVVAFEGGEVLRVGIIVETPATDGSGDPAALFRTTPPTPFSLTFESVQSQLVWDQRFGGIYLPEASVGVAAQMSSDARARHLAARRTLEVVLSAPVDVTGREQWLTSGAVLEFTHQGRVHRAPIIDFALESTGTGSGPSAPTKQILRRLTLGQVIRDLPAGSSEANPQPALPVTLLGQALANQQGVQLRCAVRVPSLQSAQVAVTTDFLTQLDSAQGRLLATRGADLLLDARSQGAEEPSHQQVTAVSQVGNNRFAFLVREMRADRAVTPLAVGQRATLYAVYRQSVDVTANDTAKALFARDTSPGAKRKHLKLAVRAHASYEGRGSPLSNMVPLTVAPSAPEVSASLVAQGECEDPFKVVDYTSLPKVLNNRKVVQYKLVPKEILKRHAETSGIPEVSLPSGAMEVLRASEDRIRLAASLGGDAAYCAIVTALVKEWASSPEIRGAFEPVGRLSETNADLIDEVEGTASGNLYYAIRSIREGGVPSNIQLLPIRVEIPDLSRPPSPQRVRRIASERVVTLQVEYPKASKTSGLFLYRTDSMQRDSDLVAMTKIAVVTLTGQSLDESLFAPLRLEVVNKRNRVVARKISNWFPVSPRPLEVLGVFRRGDFNPAAIPMSLQASPNLFQADQGSVFDLNTAEIRGLSSPPNDGGSDTVDVAVVYTGAQRVSIVLPNAVKAGTLQLPRIRRILALYQCHEFDPSSEPLEKQPAINLLDSAHPSEYVDSVAARVVDGTAVAAVYENNEGGISYLDKIAVHDGRIVIPFGAQLRMIVGIYRPEDRDHVANLLSPGATVDLVAGRVTNLALPEDATVLVECEVAAQFASYGSSHCRLPIPSYVAKNTILALVPKSESAPEIYNDEWLRREDLLRFGWAIDGSVLTFGQILDQGARVQLVTGDVSGKREALSLNENLIEIVDKDGDRAMSRYRVVAFKRVRVSEADTLDILSEPTTLL